MRSDERSIQPSIEGATTGATLLDACDFSLLSWIPASTTRTSVDSCGLPPIAEDKLNEGSRLDSIRARATSRPAHQRSRPPCYLRSDNGPEFVTSAGSGRSN